MLNNHPQVTPKDQLEDVIHYLRYVTKFAPPEIPEPIKPIPLWYWSLVILLSLTATFAGTAMASWVSLRIALRFVGW